MVRLMTRSPRDLPRLEPSSRAEWRAWLEANHDSTPGVLLAIGKKGRTRTTLTYEEAVEEAVRFNWIDSTTHPLDEDRYSQLFTPRKSGSTWSRSNRERIARLETQGLLLPKTVAAIEAAKADGSWSQLDDVDNLVVPDDLAAALAAEPGASGNFERFSASQRKLALYWIDAAKRPETRAKRIEAAVRAAAENKTLF